MSDATHDKLQNVAVIEVRVAAVSEVLSEDAEGPHVGTTGCSRKFTGLDRKRYV